jgi:hypothetical protein
MRRPPDGTIPNDLSYWPRGIVYTCFDGGRKSYGTPN